MEESFGAKDQDEAAVREWAAEVLAKFQPHRDAAANAMQRIGLYAPTLYDLADRAYQIVDVDSTSAPEVRARSEKAYRAAADRLAAAARTELGIVAEARSERFQRGGPAARLGA